MKIISIIFCVLTIIMLTALMITIIKTEDKTTSNKEKKYILLYIISFIILMISSIILTLENNILGIILFIIFLVVLTIATINYILYKKSLNSKIKTIVPNKLKDNLVILKEERDGYTYKVKTNLSCCNDNDFKVEQINSKDINIVHCTCNKCQTIYEVYNSELDGYNLSSNNDVKIIKEKFKSHSCPKCHNNSYKVEINYEYLDNLEDIKELKKLGIKDLSNTYINIKMNLTCNKCNKKEKEYINYEHK